jgi:CheY-like chemotaxis protein
MAAAPNSVVGEGRQVVREVLVVDDEQDIRTAVRMILEDTGYVVTEATDGHPALAHLQAAAVGLVVLLDVQMPGMDGITLLEKVAVEHGSLIRRHAFVLMTARAGRTMPLRLATWLQELGVSVLSKPFDLDDLVAVVRHAEARLSTALG